MADPLQWLIDTVTEVGNAVMRNIPAPLVSIIGNMNPFDRDNTTNYSSGSSAVSGDIKELADNTASPSINGVGREGAVASLRGANLPDDFIPKTMAWFEGLESKLQSVVNQARETTVNLVPQNVDMNAATQFELATSIPQQQQSLDTASMSRKA